MKQFDHAPMQQSIVDQVVFGRDMDFSGETQFDVEFAQLFDGSAGRKSWETAPEGKTVTKPSDVPGMSPQRARGQGLRTWKESPTMQSLVDQVVFGRDIDMSGETQFDESFTQMFNGSAGRPSWADPPIGLRTTFEPMEQQGWPPPPRANDPRQRDRYRRMLGSTMPSSQRRPPPGARLAAVAARRPLAAWREEAPEETDGGGGEPSSPGLSALSATLRRFGGQRRSRGSDAAASSASASASAPASAAMCSVLPAP